MLNGPLLPAPFSRVKMELGSWRPGGGCRLIGFHTPNTANGSVEVATTIGAMGVRVSVTVVRGVVVTPGKTDNRSGTIRIAVNTAIVRRSHGTAAPAAPTTMQAAPGGFGRNGW